MLINVCLKIRSKYAVEYNLSKSEVYKSYKNSLMNI